MQNKQLPIKSFAPFFLGTSVGIQWLVSLLAIVGLHPRSRPLVQLTDAGKYWFRPEYDVLFYVIGCGFTIALIALLHAFYSKTTRKIAQKNTSLIMLATISFIAHSVLLLLFQHRIIEFWHMPLSYGIKAFVTVGYGLVLIIPGIIAIIGFLTVSEYIHLPYKNFYHLYKLNIRWHFVDLFVIAAIWLAVYVPNWQLLSGHIYMSDQFLHWDGFFMRTLTAFQHNMILGKDIFIQYGVGWPIFMSWLFPEKAQYGTVIHAAIVYACIYYSGVYLLLRLLTKNIGWSAIGILLTLNFQLFSRNFPLPFYWDAPSSTILRSPMDIWFFIVLFFAHKSRKYLLLAVSAVFIGLALLFEFDTGIYLFVVFAIYIIYRILREKEAHIVLLLLVVPGIVFCLGLFVGNIPILQTSIWTDLFEGLSEYGSGISNIPIAILKPTYTLVAFELMIGFYLLIVGNTLLRRKHIFPAMLALYGLATMLIFMSRSHYLNLLHPSIPFWILLIWFVSRIPINNYILAPLLTIVGGALIVNPSFQHYPHMFTLFTQPTSNTYCMLQDSVDICDLPQEELYTAEQILSAATQIKRLAQSGKTVAVFDNKDTLLALASKTSVWFRYRPGEIFTIKQLESVHRHIENGIPDYIVMQEKSDTEIDVVRQTREYIQNYYQARGTFGIYEFWEYTN